MVQYEIKVTGRVQGVGFRYYTVQQAEIFKLKGWVRNTVDGGVLVMVQGDKEVIETFIDYLRIGPTYSRVTNVSYSAVQTQEQLTNFSIKY